MLNKQCLIYKLLPPKLYKRMHLTTRLYGMYVHTIYVHERIILYITILCDHVNIYGGLLQDQFT